MPRRLKLFRDLIDKHHDQNRQTPDFQSPDPGRFQSSPEAEFRLAFLGGGWEPANAECSAARDGGADSQASEQQ